MCLSTSFLDSAAALGSTELGDQRYGIDFPPLRAHVILDRVVYELRHDARAIRNRRVRACRCVLARAQDDHRSERADTGHGQDDDQGDERARDPEQSRFLHVSRGTGLNGLNLGKIPRPGARNAARRPKVPGARRRLVLTRCRGWTMVSPPFRN